jgi:predicted HTH transcriptional regulator
MKGIVPLMMTLEKLRQPHGPVPGNPLIAESLYLTKYIERMGTGVGDMIERCLNAGLQEPEFFLTDVFVTIIRRKPEQVLKTVSWQSTPQVGTKL